MSSLASALNALAQSVPQQPSLKDNPTLYGIRTFLYGQAVRGNTGCTLPVIKTKAKRDMIVEYLREQGFTVPEPIYEKLVKGWLITIEWRE